MNTLLVRRLVLTVVPFTLMGAVVLMAIFGDHGLVRRHELRQSQVEVEARIADVHRRNSELRRQLRLMDENPVGLERMAAEELLMAQPGATIYRFVDDDSSE
ncbi:MAG: septum formation initiator family protein [Alphaproteobacteria bacterium]|nr:septum formation initiator family protein [Alphaproteobacteria bacterium]